MLNVTLEEFLAENKELDFFSEKDAKLFYRMISCNNIRPAVLVVFNQLTRICLYSLNDSLGLLSEHHSMVDRDKVRQSFYFRLDDYVVTIDGVPGLGKIYGNYLISDLFTLDLNSPTGITIAKEETILMLMSYNAGVNKTKLVDDIYSDLTRNMNSMDTTYMVRLFFYITFLSHAKGPELDFVRALVANEYKRVRTYLIFLLRDFLALSENQSRTISRINFLRINSLTDFNTLMSNNASHPVFGRLFTFLNLYTV